MISVQEAKDLILQNIQLLETETVCLSSAYGMILAQAVVSKIDVPAFDNSAMDGYAVKYDDQIHSFRVTQYIQAGELTNMELNSGEAAQIFTGAPIPKNADTVIPRELISVSDGNINFSPNIISRGMHIRKRASQNATDEIIAQAGAFMNPGLIALLSSCGVQSVVVYKRPSVSFIVTGNELIEPGNPLPEGSVYNSNGPAIYSFLQLCGIQSIHAFSAPDQKNTLREKIEQALDCSDVVILTGGVSAGDFDFVPQVLAELGVQKLFHKVKQKPGKPIYCGKKNNQWIFGLPGNPAAVLACLNQYVKPCLFGISGHHEIFRQFVVLAIAHTWTKKPGLSHILKVKMEGQKVKILDGQESFNLLPFNECNGFMVMDEDTEVLEKGARVNVYPI
ncbi:MAG: molybdopterin molybdotransferase MoeA [Saprospiraceae bacterium]|nr:molybdopterin molybdotransferase MoeA [Saprospiraceae bacterium]